MTRLLFLSLLLLRPAIAQEAPIPEECLVAQGIRAAIVVTHEGKEYRLASGSCREQFLSDPERYAQLYDALAELAAAGVTVEKPRSASLVPS